jgi:hypothetical protein
MVNQHIPRDPGLDPRAKLHEQHEIKDAVISLSPQLRHLRASVIVRVSSRT